MYTIICQILLMKKLDLERLNNLPKIVQTKKLQRLFLNMVSLAVQLKFLNTGPASLNLRGGNVRLMGN